MGNPRWSIKPWKRTDIASSTVNLSFGCLCYIGLNIVIIHFPIPPPKSLLSKLYMGRHYKVGQGGTSIGSLEDLLQERDAILDDLKLHGRITCVFDVTTI